MFHTIQVDELGDVAIVTFQHTKILDDTVIESIKSELATLGQDTSGNVVVDFSGVQFISSSMIGGLILFQKTLSLRGKKLVLAGLTAEVEEVFKITRLTKFFEICRDLDKALRTLERRFQYRSKCPIASCLGTLSLEWADSTNLTVECPACECLLSVTRSDCRQFDRALLVEIRVPTYVNQCIRIECPTASEPFFSIVVDGELDLYVAESLEIAWLAIPKPRAIVIDLTSCTVISDLAIASLSGLEDDAETLAISLCVKDDGIGKSWAFPAFSTRSEGIANLLARLPEKDRTGPVQLNVESVAVNGFKAEG